MKDVTGFRPFSVRGVVVIRVSDVRIRNLSDTEYTEKS